MFKGAVVAEGLMLEIKYPVGAVVVLKPVVTVGEFTAPYNRALVVTERVPSVVTVTAQVAPHAVMVVPAENVADTDWDRVYVPMFPTKILGDAMMVVPETMLPPETVIPILMTPESKAETASDVPDAVAVKIAAVLEMENWFVANGALAAAHANVGIDVRSCAVVIMPQELMVSVLPACVKYTCRPLSSVPRPSAVNTLEATLETAKEGALESTFLAAAGHAPPGVHCVPPLLVGRAFTNTVFPAVVKATRWGATVLVAGTSPAIRAAVIT